MTETPETRYRRRPEVVARKVAGEMLLVPLASRAVDENMRSAELYVLNHTGEYLWQQLSSPQSVSELARNLMNEFQITAELARVDVENFIAALSSVGAVDAAGQGEHNGSR